MTLERAMLLVACLSAVACSDANFAVGASQGDDGLGEADAREDGVSLDGAGDVVAIDVPDTGSIDVPDTGSSPDTGTPDTGVTPDTGTVKPDTAPDAPSCTPPTVDLDGDGEAPPPGVCGTDCHDGNKDVFSKQKAFFTAAYSKVGGGSSFDFDCDGVETPQWSKKYVCTPGVGLDDCAMKPVGLETDVVPPCGAPARIVSGCKRVGSACEPYLFNTVTQACR